MNDETRVSSRAVAGLFLALSLGSGASMGCTSAGSAVPTLGLLEDYAELAPGRPGEASLI